MIPEQQRFWIALLNLQRTWASDRTALSFIPPRHRDFKGKPWTQDKAQAYLLNNLELVRESHGFLESGQALEFDLINHVLGGLTLQLQAWHNADEVRQAAQAKAELGGRLEVLQALAEDDEELNAGTRYIRASVQRAFYYFAQYVDDRLSDPAYPEVSPNRWQVRLQRSGDLELMPPREQAEASDA